METEQAELVMERLASRQGVSKGHIVREIENAITLAMQSSYEAVRRRWEKMFPDGRRPSAAELLQVLSVAVLKSELS